MAVRLQVMPPTVDLPPHVQQVLAVQLGFGVIQKKGHGYAVAIGNIHHGLDTRLVSVLPSPDQAINVIPRGADSMRFHIHGNGYAAFSMNFTHVSLPFG